jgi:hypothetical protein
MEKFNNFLPEYSCATSYLGNVYLCDTCYWSNGEMCIRQLLTKEEIKEHEEKHKASKKS